MVQKEEKNDFVILLNKKNIEILKQTKEQRTISLKTNKKKSLIIKEYNLDMLNDKKLSKIMTKIKKSKTLSHKNLINYNLSFINKNKLSIIFDKQEINFHQIIQNLFPEGILQWDLLRAILHPFVKSLNYLHSQNLVHKNITSESLFIGKDGVIRLNFFNHFEKKRSCDKTIIGCICYLAPELFCEDFKGYDEKVDIFAFGSFVWELLNGRRHYNNFSFLEAVYKITDCKEVNLDKFRKILPKKFIRLISKCLAKNAEKRPSSGELLRFFDNNKYKKDSNKLIKEKIILRYRKTIQNNTTDSIMTLDSSKNN